jgi:hypothetical protein
MRHVAMICMQESKKDPSSSKALYQDDGVNRRKFGVAVAQRLACYRHYAGGYLE